MERAAALRRVKKQGGLQDAIYDTVSGQLDKTHQMLYSVFQETLVWRK
jgi:hypothetical protein